VSLRRVKSDQPDFASLNQISSPPAGLSHGRIAGFHLTAFALLDMVGAGDLAACNQHLGLIGAPLNHGVISDRGLRATLRVRCGSSKSSPTRRQVNGRRLTAGANAVVFTQNLAHPGAARMRITHALVAKKIDGHVTIWLPVQDHLRRFREI
jgi:hypothetical protein